MKHIGIIGTGVMGGAIAEGIRNRFADTEIVLSDQLSDKAAKLADRIGGRFSERASELGSQMKDVEAPIILAVKPQQLADLSSEIGSLCEKSRLISIAAGTSFASLRELFPGADLIRFMPNIAAKIGKSVVAIATERETSRDFVDAAMEIAGTIGLPVPLDEKRFSAFTGLSGSGIAYVLSFIHALSLGGTEMGIPYSKSLDIALQTITGATELLKNQRGNPAEMITQVTSAGGTTIRGVAALEEGAFTATVMSAVREAARKAEDMEKRK